jgi:hypothetical protein
VAEADATVSAEARMNNDAEHLRLLSIFHFVVGGLAALFALLPAMHLFMGIAMVSGRFDEGPNQTEARFFGWFFIIVASAMIVAGLAFATSMILAGRFLAQRVYYTFCLVVAALECVFVPFGTVLGVFTIVVLQRPTVKEMFGMTIARDGAT